MYGGVFLPESFTAIDAEKLKNLKNYTHPDESGYKHIPKGGSEGQILWWKDDGEAKWADAPEGGAGGTGGGSGDVKGPGSSEEGNIPVFSGDDGKNIEDSGVSIDDVKKLILNALPFPDNIDTAIEGNWSFGFNHEGISGTFPKRADQTMLDGFIPEGGAADHALERWHLKSEKLNYVCTEQTISLFIRIENKNGINNPPLIITWKRGIYGAGENLTVGEWAYLKIENKER